MSREGDGLYISRNDGEPTELLPPGEHRFFRRGQRGEIVFVAGASGSAQKLIQRRDDNDIVWTRL